MSIGEVKLQALRQWATIEKIDLENLSSAGLAKVKAHTGLSDAEAARAAREASAFIEKPSADRQRLTGERTAHAPNPGRDVYGVSKASQAEAVEKLMKSWEDEFPMLATHLAGILRPGQAVVLAEDGRSAMVLGIRGHGAELTVSPYTVPYTDAGGNPYQMAFKPGDPDGVPLRQFSADGLRRSMERITAVAAERDRARVYPLPADDEELRSVLIRNPQLDRSGL
jgi:hypothetical protein